MRSRTSFFDRRVSLHLLRRFWPLWLAWLAAKINGMSIRNAKAASGVTEETDTYMGWKERGYEVIHGSKALFGCDLVYITKNTTYKARFFGASQVQKIA